MTGMNNLFHSKTEPNRHDSAMDDTEKTSSDAETTPIRLTREAVKSFNESFNEINNHGDYPISTGRAHRRRSSLEAASHVSGISRISSIFYAPVVNPEEGLSQPTLTCIVINYISAGYILLPSAFAQGGLLLSSLILAAVSVQSYVTTKFILESCARAEALNQEDVIASRHSADDISLPASHIFAPTPLDEDEAIAIRERKFEISLLNKLFLGRFWEKFFLLTTCLDLYGITWAFCSVFASSFSDLVPISDALDDRNYQVYVTIFATVTVPLACTSLLDQLYLQLAFLTGRMVMLLIMISTLAHAFVHPDIEFFYDQAGPARETGLANWPKLLLLVQTCVFATAFQFSVPAIGSVSADKKVISHIFSSAVGFIFMSNLILSLLMAVFFGSQTEDASNLNWLGFHDDCDEGDHTCKGWANVVSYYVALFAAIDGLAVYPLISLSLGDLMMSAYYGELVHEAEKNWKKRTVFRIAASFPQAFCALFVKDLGKIALFAGIFTLLSYTTCPAMLYLASARVMKAANLTHQTFYSSPFFTGYMWAYCLIALSSLLIVGVIVETVIQEVAGSAD